VEMGTACLTLAPKQDFTVKINLDGAVHTGTI
jgi:hypothetical protein